MRSTCPSHSGQSRKTIVSPFRRYGGLLSAAAARALQSHRGRTADVAKEEAACEFTDRLGVDDAARSLRLHDEIALLLRGFVVGIGQVLFDVEKARIRLRTIFRRVVRVVVPSVLPIAFAFSICIACP